VLRIWFGQGRWDYARRVDRHEEASPRGITYHAELHALSVSNRGAALDKGGAGFTLGRAVTNLVSIGDAVR
jgi:hypothetical protein